MMKQMIWTSRITFEDWEDFLQDTYSEASDDADKYCICFEMNRENLSDIKLDFSVQDYEHPIICIADVGRWNGRFPAWRFIGDEYKGASLSDIFSFSEGDDQEFFIEDGELRCNDFHHDAANHYIYRVFICDPDDAWPLINRIERGEDYQPLLNKYTKSLAKDVCEIYGW